VGTEGPPERMDPMAIVPNFTSADVEENYDSRSFSRARGLITSATVGDVEVVGNELIFNGHVRGTRLYSVETVASSTPSGVFISSTCTCPVSVQCKHGAALALRHLQQAGKPVSSGDPTVPEPLQFPQKAREPEADDDGMARLLAQLGLDASQVFRASDIPGQPGRGSAGAPARSPGALPDWERRLNEISEEMHRSKVPHERSPLALRFSVEERPASRWNPNPAPLLNIQAMKKGKRGSWIKSGAGWTALGQPWNETKFVSSHFAALSRLGEALRAQGTEPVSTYQLSEATPQMWRALVEAQEAGVEFLAEGTATAVRLAEDPVDLRLGVDATGDDAMVLFGVAWNDFTCAGSAVTPIGRRAFAVALLPSEATEGELVLARFRTPLSERLTVVLGHGQQIDVPAEDRGRLADEVLPRVVAFLEVASDDPDFRPEPPAPPALVALVGWDEEDRATLDFRFRYTQGGEAHDVFMEPSLRSQRVDRSLENELQVLDEWEHGPVTRQLVEFTGGRPAGSMTYSGGAAVRVVMELVPELREQMTVEFAPDVPDLYEFDGDPEISFDVVDSGEDPHIARRRPTRRAAAETDDAQDGRDTSGAEQEEKVPDESGEIDWLDLHVVIRVDSHEVPLPDILAALTRHEDVMVVDGDVVLRLDHPAFERLKALVQAAESSGLRARKGGDVRVGTADAAIFKEAEDLGVLPDAVQRWTQAHKPLLDSGEAPHVDAVGVVTPLRGYQQDGLNWMHHLYTYGLGGILADDMGLGKTLQTLALISTVKGRRRLGSMDGPFLVVAPTSVVPAWKEQAERHTPGLRVETITATAKRRGRSIADLAADVDVLVTSYTLLRQEIEAYEELAWKGLVLDESQAIKNPASKTFHAVRRIGADFALAVTGTPFENRLTELWPPLSIVAPGLYPTLEGFRTHVARPVEKENDTDALALMRKRIAPYLLRRSKSLVAQDLPEKQEEVLSVALDRGHRKFYDTLLQRERQAVLGLVEDFDSNKVAIFAALTRMRMAALHAGLAGGDEDLPSAKLTELVNRLRELADEGHRALVFSQFVTYLKVIRAALEEAGLECVYLDGSTQDRGRVLQAFRMGKAPVFLISLKAGGTGLTLTEADYVFVMDPWWNPAVEAQAVDRAHRLGQTKQVMVYRMVSEGTIEEKVMELKSRKAALFDSVIGDGTVDAGKFIDGDDIRGLME
jgi:superfamily II DNA or RNA helicase